MSKIESSMGRESGGYRCAVCGKTVRLYKYMCRCGALYCPIHRFADRHNCTFDYESHGVEPLRHPPVQEQHENEVSNAPVKRKRYRCAVCRSLVGLNGHKCQCGGLYCPIHRLTDRHDCTFYSNSHCVRPIARNCRQGGAADDKALAAASTKEQAEKEVSNAPVKRKRYRCAVCRRLVGLNGRKCQCGGLYCPIHRLTDRHNCTFDYESHGVSPLASSAFQLNVEQPRATQHSYMHCEYTLQISAMQRD